MLHDVVVFFYILSSSIYIICARVKASFHVIFDTENGISMSQPIPILTTKKQKTASITPKDVTSIYFLLHIVKGGVVAVSDDGLALALEGF